MQGHLAARVPRTRHRRGCYACRTALYQRVQASEGAIAQREHRLAHLWRQPALGFECLTLVFVHGV